jgi:hypothetical protein
MFEPISQLTKRQKILRLFFFFILLSDLAIRHFHFRSFAVEFIIEVAFALCIIGFLLEGVLKRRNPKN